MSHFTVLVIGDNPEKQLAPFQENNMEDCPKEFLEFDIQAEGIEGIKKHLKAEFNRWEERSKEEGRDKESVSKCLEWKKEAQEKLDNESWDEVVSEEGWSKHEGNYGYWHNPNAKWDWYQLGGRWQGMLKIKEGSTGQRGSRSLLQGGGTGIGFDQAKLKDIDLDTMKDIDAKKAGEEYDKFHKTLGDLPFPPVWSKFREAFDDIDDARKAYWENESAKAVGEYHEPHRFNCTREEFQQRAKDDVLTTFAVLKDGEWYERGSMGWFGMVSNEKDPQEWGKQIQELLKNLPGETLISIYDCHI